MSLAISQNTFIQATFMLQVVTIFILLTKLISLKKDTKLSDSKKTKMNPAQKARAEFLEGTQNKKLTLIIGKNMKIPITEIPFLHHVTITKLGEYKIEVVEE